MGTLIFTNSNIITENVTVPHLSTKILKYSNKVNKDTSSKQLLVKLSTSSGLFDAYLYDFTASSTTLKKVLINNQEDSVDYNQKEIDLLLINREKDNDLTFTIRSERKPEAISPVITGLIIPGASVQPAGMWLGKEFRFVGKNLGIKSDVTNYNSFSIWIDGKKAFYSASDTSWKNDGFLYYSSSGLTNGGHSIYVQYNHLENGVWITKTGNTYNFQVINKPTNPTITSAVLTDIGHVSCQLNFTTSNTHGLIKINVNAFHTGAGSAYYINTGTTGQTSFTISPIPSGRIEYYLYDDWNYAGWMNPSSEGCACLRCDNRFYVIITSTSPLASALNPTMPYSECQ